MNASFIIYAEMESLLEKIDTRHSNPKMASTTKLLLVIAYLRIVSSMLQKTSMIIIEVKIV